MNKKTKKKDMIDLNKADDQTRRSFIRNTGIFLAAFGVPSLIRIESMGKLSKRILGNTYAFAQGVGTTPAIMEFRYRSGYGPAQWITGMSTDHQVTNVNRNVPWEPGTVVNTPTSFVPLNLPSQSTDLTPYANSIQGVNIFASQGGHTSFFNMSGVMGKGELMAWKASTNVANGESSITTSPVGFLRDSSFDVKSLPANLAIYTPQTYTSIQGFYEQFSSLTLNSSQGNEMPAEVRDLMFNTLNSKFTEDITNILRYSNNKETAQAASDNAYAILKTNLSNELNPDSADNAAKLALLTAGLPAAAGNSAGGGPMGVDGGDAAKSILSMMNAMSLGVSPKISAQGFRTGDHHSNFQVQGDALGTAAATNQFSSSSYLGILCKNLLDMAAAGEWTDPNTGENMHVMISHLTEFNRTYLAQPNTASGNGDGGSNGTLLMHSDVNQTIFKPGSIGGITAAGTAMGFDPATQTHSAATPRFTLDQCRGHMMKVYGIDPADFDMPSDHVEGLLG